MRSITILFTLLLITGCAGNQWEQQGKSVLQGDEDSLACTFKLEKDKDWYSLPDKERDIRIEKCMTEKGYKKRASDSY
jgi:chlorite dismutase